MDCHQPLFRLHWAAEDSAPDSADELDLLPSPLSASARPAVMLDCAFDTPAERLIPRGYQLELFRRACCQNIVALLETGAGKTLVSALLIKKTLEDLEAVDRLPGLPTEGATHSVAQNPTLPVGQSPTQGLDAPSQNGSLLPAERQMPSQEIQDDGVAAFSKSAKPAAPCKKFAVFLVHRVPLVPQQAEVIKSVMHPHVHVGSYYGGRGVDDWSSSKWANSLRKHKVLVMTAQIFLNLLRHGLLDIRNVALLVLDEAHHATKNHPFRRIFVEFYHTLGSGEPRPRVFGMTATPVKAKTASQLESLCLDAIVALEAALDATVVTVSNESLAEVDELVPKPEEFVVTYTSSTSNLDLDEEEANELDSSGVDTVMEIAGLSEAEPGQSSPVQFETQKHGLAEFEAKLLSFLRWKVGFRVASHFAKQLCASRKVSPTEVILNILKESTKEELDNGGIPQKNRKLLDVLFSEYMRTREANKSSRENGLAEKFRCIVFVKERVTAIALTWLINEVFKGLSCAELAAKPAVGVQNTDSHVRMTQAKLLEILAHFRVGKFGILVATNVVEEGLDIPACCLVAAFDPVVTPAAYVQGRGRARKKGARYISFLEFGSIHDYNSLLEAREGARLMSLVARDGVSTDEQRELHRQKILRDANAEEKVLFSKTSRAQVSSTEAVNLLNRYCMMKAAVLQDEEFSRPQYVCHKSEWGFTGYVQVHPRIPIDVGVCEVPQESEAHAKRLAALDAYSKLYQTGEVDEYLLPRRPGRSRRVLRVIQQLGESPEGVSVKRRKRRGHREVESKESKKGKRLRSCRIAHPASVQNRMEEKDPRVSKEGIDGELSATSIQQTVSCHREVSFSPDNMACGPHDDGEVNCERLLYSLRIDHDTTHLGFHDTSANLSFGILLKNKVCTEDLKAMQCPAGNDLITLSFEKVIVWSEAMQEMAYKYVRSVQLCLRGKSPGSEAAIDIEAKEYGTDKNTGFLLLPLVFPKDYESVAIDWESIAELLSFGWRCGPLRENEYNLGHGIEHVLACSYHEGFDRVYLTGELNEKLLASSHPSGLLNRSYASFVDYFQRKHYTSLSMQDQVMLEGFSVLDKISRLSTSTFMLPPETCRVIPLPPLACYIASLLPRWQTFLALRSCWRQNRITSRASGFLPFARALQPNVNNVSKGGADLSYERLEFLGDAVLKVIFSMAAFVMNPDDDEGLLSDERDIEVSNQKLADRALEMNIDNCVAFSGVSQKAKSWPWFWATHQNKSIQISEKVLADCVEALIGTQYLEGGVELAAIFMDRHKLLPGRCKVLGIGENGEPGPGVSVRAPGEKLLDDRRESQFVRDVESIVGYRFRDRRHLVVALTHGSFKNGNVPSYQRYEYLGDAIIGFLLLSHFFRKYPDLGPGDLTSLRGPALSNDLFARVIVSWKIHEKFWFDCPALVPEIRKFERLVANEEGDSDDVCKTMTVPKVLGDLLEAVIGAIVVDKGMRLDGVQEIVLRLMEVELNRFANPQKFQNSPVSELVHLSQKTHGVLPVYKYLDRPQDVQKKCAIYVNGKPAGTGTGPTRRVAKHKAARASLVVLKEKGRRFFAENESQENDVDMGDCSAEGLG